MPDPVTDPAPVTVPRWLLRGYSWESSRGNVCPRRPSRALPTYTSIRLGFRVFLRVRELRGQRE